MDSQHFQVWLDARSPFHKKPTTIGFLKMRSCPIRGNDNNVPCSFEDGYIGAVVTRIVKTFRAVMFCKSPRFTMRRKIVFASRGQNSLKNTELRSNRLRQWLCCCGRQNQSAPIGMFLKKIIKKLLTIGQQ